MSRSGITITLLGCLVALIACAYTIAGKLPVQDNPPARTGPVQFPTSQSATP